MKKILLSLLLIFVFSGCTKTFYGVQEDSQNIWENTRDAVHRATSP